MDRINELFESANDKRAREKEELMQLSEKELLAEILLELRKINETTRSIYHNQIFD
ncbi:MAG: hypothetical protein IKB84_01545 [Clostridia bacterium]|nr:hypothetical protein [Clostridia bacterium]